MYNRLRTHINFTRPVWVRGKRFNIPVWGGIEVPGVRSTRKTEVIARYARPWGAFVDIGINLGQTLIDAKLTHPDIEYIGFEPNPVCVAYVRQLVAANRFQHCTVIPSGLSDTSGLVRLHSAPNQPADHASTIIPALRSHQTSTQFVSALVFDEISLVLCTSSIGFVKIDVEGAELNVLKGMKDALARDLPPILCEVLPQAGGRDPAEMDARRSELLTLIHSLGYLVYHVEDDKKDKITLRKTSQFNAGPFNRRYSWDYLFLASGESPG